MAELKEKKRDSLKSSTFGLPEERKYPMPDKSHAANAKARASQQVETGNLTKPRRPRSTARPTGSSTRILSAGDSAGDPAPMLTAAWALLGSASRDAGSTSVELGEVPPDDRQRPRDIVVALRGNRHDLWLEPFGHDDQCRRPLALDVELHSSQLRVADVECDALAEGDEQPSMVATIVTSPVSVIACQLFIGMQQAQDWLVGSRVIHDRSTLSCGLVGAPGSPFGPGAHLGR